MNDKNTSIERFFRELSRRMYKENDLSDMVYALCRSNSDFMQFFLNFIFGVGKLNATDFRIEREVSFENNRPDFVLTKKDSGERYFIEVKIGDRSQHFAQYSTQLAKLNSNLDFNVIDDVADITKYLGYITNYEIQEGELSSGDKTAFNGCKGNGTYHTWSEFKDALYKSKLVGDLNEDIRGLLAYCEMVCPSQQEDEQITEYTHDPDNFREINKCYSALEDYLSKRDKDKVEVLGHNIKIKKYRVANTPAESIGIYFEAQDESTGISEKDKMCEGKKIWGWAGWLLTEGFHPGFCVAFDNNNGWGAPVFESLNKQDESWMPFCNNFEAVSEEYFSTAFKNVFSQIIDGKKEDCKHDKDKDVNTSLYAARALPLYLKQQVFPKLSCPDCIIVPFLQKDSFNPKSWCGEYFAVKTNPKDGEEGRQVGVYWVGAYFDKYNGKIVCEKIGVAIKVLERDQSLADQINKILKENIENSVCSVGEN